METSIPGVWNPLGIGIGASHNQVYGDAREATTARDCPVFFTAHS